MGLACQVDGSVTTGAGLAGVGLVCVSFAAASWAALNSRRDSRGSVEQPQPPPAWALRPPAPRRSWRRAFWRRGLANPAAGPCIISRPTNELVDSAEPAENHPRVHNRTLRRRA